MSEALAWDDLTGMRLDGSQVVEARQKEREAAKRRSESEKALVLLKFNADQATKDQKEVRIGRGGRSGNWSSGHASAGS